MNLSHIPCRVLSVGEVILWHKEYSFINLQVLTFIFVNHLQSYFRVIEINVSVSFIGGLQNVTVINQRTNGTVVETRTVESYYLTRKNMNTKFRYRYSRSCVDENKCLRIISRNPSDKWLSQSNVHFKNHNAWCVIIGIIFFSFIWIPSQQRTKFIGHFDFNKFNNEFKSHVQ